MDISISRDHNSISGELIITGSKSESNRLLILKALYPSIEVHNLSNSHDTKVMLRALKSSENIIDIHHAGTAMRFLTAYFSIQEGREVVLTGSARMQERPIKLLVDALRSMGADISYEKEDGYPPLRIKGKRLTENKVSLLANISSQYISALMLIASSLPEGLEICLDGPVTSVPYINMSLQLLNQVGIQGTFEGQRIAIEPSASIPEKTIHVESDWSSASYFYSLAAISDNTELKLSNYRSTSLQGDACLASIYKQFGVETRYEDNSIVLSKNSNTKPAKLIEDLRNAPDIAQTIAVTCLALGLECEMHGLHTLKIKETDRLVALKNELEKFGAQVEITHDSLKLYPTSLLNKNVEVATYNDHRMAMAFAPLALKVPLKIMDAMVVEKSFPTFWEDLEVLDFKISPSNQD